MKKAGIERHEIAAALSDFAFVFAFAELGAPVAERLYLSPEKAEEGSRGRKKGELSLSHRVGKWGKNGKYFNHFKVKFSPWRSLRESNPCFSLERAAS
jgi:hypothetical protein